MNLKSRSKLYMKETQSYRMLNQKIFHSILQEFHFTLNGVTVTKLFVFLLNSNQFDKALRRRLSSPWEGWRPDRGKVE